MNKELANGRPALRPLPYLGSGHNGWRDFFFRACRFACELSLADLLPVHWDAVRGSDPKANFVAFDLHHCDRDVVVNHDRFALLTRQYQHL